MLGFVRIMNIFCSEYLFGFQSYWSRDILHGNFRLLFGMSMFVIKTLLTNLTFLCHIYVEGFHITGFQLLRIVTGASMCLDLTTYLLLWTGQKILFGRLWNLLEIQDRKVRWYSFVFKRTQNRLVFLLIWPELTVLVLFIIYMPI